MNSDVTRMKETVKVNAFDGFVTSPVWVSRPFSKGENAPSPTMPPRMAIAF